MSSRNLFRSSSLVVGQLLLSLAFTGSAWSHEKVYMADYTNNMILRSDLDGTNLEKVVVDQKGPVGVAIDAVEGKIYWTNFAGATIMRADIDGSNIQPLIDSGLKIPAGIALDLLGKKMYFTDQGTQKIQRANLNGNKVEDLVTTGLKAPAGIALDVIGGKMYWADSGTAMIQRANLDGSNVEDLVPTGLSFPIGLSLDLLAGKMYWADWTAQKIQRANLDGTKVEDIVDSGLVDPIGTSLDLDGGKVYWSEFNGGSGRTRRANLDGGKVEELASGLGGLQLIELGPSKIANPWTDLGFALSGLHGDPTLTGKGSLEGGSAVQLALANARESALSFLVIGLTQVNLPFAGGTLVPFPNFISILGTSPSGEVSLSEFWPAGIPDGSEIYFQWWIDDPAGVQGFAASNALRAINP